VADPTVGIVANPLSGRDIRRVVAQASVFPNAEKANMVQRMLTSLKAVGVPRVLMSTDLGGISAAVLRATKAPGGRLPWPEVEFLDEDRLTESAADTTNAVRRMVGRGAGVIICLGGDGTARLAAAACGDTPLLALSTGTNNVFPEMCEATVAGLAAALVAIGSVEVTAGTYRASVLEVVAGDRTEEALVDVCVTSADHLGSRALWEPSTLRELYCTFAEPHAIGLSSIPGLLCPSPRAARQGVALQLHDPATSTTSVLAPIAPGRVVEIGVQSWRTLAVGEKVESRTRRGVIALDGEREIEFQGMAPVICLRDSGPRCVDVAAVLAEAARNGVLRRGHQNRGVRPSNNRRRTARNGALEIHPYDPPRER
jgi:predicted polyphosphate/ATP-dependent NAD kinase